MTRLHHTNIRVADIDRSLAFYRTLGLDAIGTLSLGPGYYLVFVGNEGSNAALELVVNESADSSYDRSPGSGHVGLEVDDLPATLEALGAIGVRVDVAPFHPGERDDLHPVAFVRDPDGVKIELLQAPWPVPQDGVDLPVT